MRHHPSDPQRRRLRAALAVGEMMEGVQSRYLLLVSGGRVAHLHVCGRGAVSVRAGRPGGSIDGSNIPPSARRESLMRAHAGVRVREREREQVQGQP